MLIEALLAVTFLAAFATLLAPNRWAGRVAFVASLLPLVGSLWMYATFEASGNALLGGDVAFETVAPWITVGPYDVSWHVGLDGLSLPLVVLTTVLTTLAIAYAWNSVEERPSQFFGLLLFTEASLVGVFSALDFFVWFVFWEFVLVPMYLLVAVWGGPRRKYAAIKFFVYTNVASLVMFVGVMMLVFASGVDSLSLAAIAGAHVGSLYGLSASTVKAVAFAAMFFGFAVKAALVPVHTWLPDAYVEAPTPVTIVLAGVVTKMGTYSLLRFNFTMLPDVADAWAPYIATIAVVTVLYGATVAIAQHDIKRLVAYSSIPSMGFVVLGLVAYTTYGMAGAAFQMVSHGFLIALLFLAAGLVEESTGTRAVEKLSGLADELPVVSALFVAGAFGYMGLPSMSGFAAEFFIFTGSFAGGYPGAAAFTAVAMFGIVVIAGYLLWTMQRVLFGPYEVEGDVTPAPRVDLAVGVVLVLLAVLLGVAPAVFMAPIQDAVQPLVAAFGGGL
ncbi:complex I subunit 4 family protein [Halospeciosus flavus]|uniref:NuoM family protein n=1 Tax=Halospeciosus flavus TaxID=3032283 RepID=A0ABD5Z491_9EURY|nr:NADH-quinone oxidoreductase subunit M [Halospeciosus flavus]